MAQAGVLLPPEPLFIVDKTWNLQGVSKSASKPKVDAFFSDQLKVYKAGHPQSQVLHETATGPHTATVGASQHRDAFEFIVASEPGGRQDRRARKAVRRHVRQRVNTIQNGSSALQLTKPMEEISLPTVQPDVGQHTARRKRNETQELSMQVIVPTSSRALYGNENAADPVGLEHYLHYYRCVIAQNAYPLESHVNFESNPVRGNCFPLALSDRLFLRTIMLISAIHYAYVNNITEPKLTDVLARQVLLELRKRIAQKDISDTTMLSVSCIALLENLLGHHSQWRVHAAGMSDMIQLRGGSDTIDTSIRWKVYRADLVGAVDHVTKPMLPHPGLRTSLNDLGLAHKGQHNTKFMMSLIAGGMSKALQPMFQHMNHMQHVIKRAIMTDIPLSAYFYDNSCMQIQHDLLDLKTDSPLDESWRIAGLVFVNTFIRSRPFLGKNCAMLSEKLRYSFGKALRILTNKSHHLWLACIGGLMSNETIDKEWFAQKLIDIVRVCDCNSWDDMKEILRQVLWLDELHDQPGQKLWDRIVIYAPRQPHSLG